MNDLRPSETDLLGTWHQHRVGVTADDTCQRISWLIAKRLVQVATDASGWDLLYRDPADGRLWELTYPQSDLQGGGPPRLHHVTEAQARDKYVLAAGPAAAPVREAVVTPTLGGLHATVAETPRRIALARQPTAIASDRSLPARK